MTEQKGEPRNILGVYWGDRVSFHSGDKVAWTGPLDRVPKIVAMTSRLEHIDILAVRCPNWVGDIVMATPALESLRRGLPNTTIVGVLKKHAQGILRDGPWFDAFVDCDDKSWSGVLHMRRQLRALAPQAAVLLVNSMRSALTLRFCGIKTLYGYQREWRRLLLAGGPKAARDSTGFVPQPMTDYYLGLCRWLGLDASESIKPRLYIGPELRQRGQAVLANHQIKADDFVIGFNPGASFGSSKCWPPAYFAELAELCVKELGARILLFSGPGEEAIVQAVLDHAKVEMVDLRKDRVDLELLKPMVERCSLLITNDTGPRHYAVALDVPVVVIMGPTDPRWTDSHTEQTSVVRRELDCSPCHKKVCPLGHHRCMKDIKPAEVFTAAETLLSACV